MHPQETFLNGELAPEKKNNKRKTKAQWPTPPSHHTQKKCRWGSHVSSSKNENKKPGSNIFPTCLFLRINAFWVELRRAIFYQNLLFGGVRRSTKGQRVLFPRPSRLRVWKTLNCGLTFDPSWAKSNLIDGLEDKHRKWILILDKCS